MTDLSGTIEVLDEDALDGDARQPGDRRRRVVKIANKDSGDTIRLRVDVDITIADVVAKMYAEFGLEQQQGDRLTCRQSGADVFQFAGITLAAYLSAGHCADLRWSFVGDTGGA